LVLLALLALPVLWWLLRLIPPQPRRIAFPPAQLLFDITPKQETPRRRQAAPAGKAVIRLRSKSFIH